MRVGYDAKRLFHNNTGLGNYSRDLVRIIAENRPEWDLKLFNPKLGNVKKYKLADNMTEIRPKGFFWKKLSGLWRRKRISKLTDKHNVDIFHGLSGELPSGIAKEQSKSIVTIHDLIFLEHPELYKPVDRKIYTLKAKKACQDADVVVSISEHTKRDIIKYFDVPEDKIEVIYQGCHPAVKSTIADGVKNELRERLGLPEKFVLNVGTVERRKNQEVIIRALKDISEEYKLIIVGRKTSYYTDVLKPLIDNLQLNNRVIFLQGLTMNDLAALYQMAEVFVYPSLYEGFGIPIIESLYSKTPVITSEGGVFPEAGGDGAEYIKSSDHKALSEKLNMILSDRKYREDMIARGYKYADRFSDNNIAKEWIELYNRVVNG